MSSNDTDTTVSEYLADVAGRVSDLPVLQRRELLADLEAHIEAERIERNAETPGQLLDILERLGTPEEIAAAAHAEAPAPAPSPDHPRVAATARRPVISATAVVVGFAILFVVAIATFLMFASSSGTVRAPEQPASVGPAPAGPPPVDSVPSMPSAPR